MSKAIKFGADGVFKGLPYVDEPDDVKGARLYTNVVDLCNATLSKCEGKSYERFCVWRYRCANYECDYTVWACRFQLDFGITTAEMVGVLVDLGGGAFAFDAIPKNETPHWLMGLCARHAMNAGADVNVTRWAAAMAKLEGKVTHG